MYRRSAVERLPSETVRHDRKGTDVEARVLGPMITVHDVQTAGELRSIGTDKSVNSQLSSRAGRQQERTYLLESFEGPPLEGATTWDESELGT
jgi:hypothetical protein